jgi:hypothetical protein
MNQHQRKFLLEAIEKQYKTERDKLRAQAPKEPSMNNYLIAAVLDGSFVMHDQSLVRDALRERVRNLGKDESLLSSRSRWREDDESNVVTLPADLLFELPGGYAKALEEYEVALSKWTEEMEALDAAMGAMRIKVQIGSDKALEALVDQADKICSMSLTASNRLLLGNGK